MALRLARIRALSGALLGLALGALSSKAARACSRPALPEFSLDPSAAGVDRQPPTKPERVTASASRYNAHFCESSGRCITSTCGSEGALQLAFTPAADDRAAAHELGYRLRWVEGSLPAALEAPLARIALGTDGLRFDLPFDAIPELDATFELIAIDRAGNESAASEPFHAVFDGCTRSVGFGGCAEDMAGRVSCADGACFETAERSRIEGGCAVAPGRGAACGALGVLPALAALALAGRTRARRRR